MVVSAFGGDAKALAVVRTLDEVLDGYASDPGLSEIAVGLVSKLQ